MAKEIINLMNYLNVEVEMDKTWYEGTMVYELWRKETTIARDR